jgi:hypothetical protein
MAIRLVTLVLASVLQSSPAADAQRVPVLVELFTSEGCSSCPPADALLARLVRDQPVPGARVIALGQHVDVWDELGWKDAFSSASFTRRQQAYVRSLGLSGAYTPQLVVGGRLQSVGSDERAARAAVAASARPADATIAARVTSAAGASPVLEVTARWEPGAADVVVAVVQDRATTRVARGENAGRTLDHVAVVRWMATVGGGTGSYEGRVPLQIPPAAGALRAVVFVQDRGAGRIRAVEELPLTVPPAPG